MTSTETVVSRAELGLANAASPEATPRACLVKIHPAGSGDGLVHLPLTRFVLGRDRDADMMLPDNAVSRMHAAIENHQGKFVLFDLDSTNGTYVNDQMVESRPLESGDFIRIGTHIVKFLASDHIETQYHETIYTMMITDGLTGVHNKRYFRESLDRELVRSFRHRRPLSLAIFDIDHFKQVNDQHTHLVGDEVLRELCARIRREIRKDEVFARYGGEEFVILLPESTIDQARMFAERLRRLIADNPVLVGPVELAVTVSIGLGETRGERETTGDELILNADQNLLRAKREGRNRVVG